MPHCANDIAWGEKSLIAAKRFSINNEIPRVEEVRFFFIIYLTFI